MIALGIMASKSIMAIDVYEHLIEALQKAHVFLTGPAGTGKSYLTQKVIATYRKLGKGVVALGSTGVSAVHIGGQTLHSFFVLGVAHDLETLRQKDRYNKKRLAELKKILSLTDLIVIDEISMVSASVMDMIAYRLESLGFEGRLLLVGDFFQLPPVQNAVNENTLFQTPLYAFESHAWRMIDPQIIALSEIKRTNDRYFASILEKIRIGTLDQEVKSYLKALLEAPRPGNDPTELYGTNKEAEAINKERLSKLEGEDIILFSEVQAGAVADQKKIEKWLSHLPVTQSLHLKVGAPVLFCVNKWGKYINGERGVVHAIEDDFLIVEKENEYVRVERHLFELSNVSVDEEGNLKEEVIAECLQYPLKLAYAVTIHKSQGMSIKHLVCNIDTIFAPSQFYVALSRAVDPKNLQLVYHKGGFERYLSQVIRVDQRVQAFYASLR